MRRLVVDTNVFIGSLLGPKGANRQVIRTCFEGKYLPLMGTKLFLEYEQLLTRRDIMKKCLLSQAELNTLVSSFMHICEWVPVYFLWRPNLKDEKDNHLVELAVAGNAKIIVTNNVKDFRYAELVFPNLKVLSPQQMLGGAM